MPAFPSLTNVFRRLLLCSLVLSCFQVTGIYAQPSERKLSPHEYVESHKEDAIKEMLMFGVPASVTLAQGMLESDNGNSDLAVYANNHFGIKCHEDWTGPSYIKDDDTKDECFRKYETVLQSYSDHSQFLRSRTRYAFLFELKTTDYKGRAHGLKESGYATDPRYADRLIDIIEKNKLYEYDKNVSMQVRQPEANLTEHITPKSSTAARSILQISERKYVIARQGDTYFKIAQDCEKGLWELYRYNEISRDAKPVAGQRVYIQPKRRKGSTDFHVVKAGETMYSISQEYCIKLKFLYRKNKMLPGTEPKEGDVLCLRHKK
jgi:LysM repeat protein